MNVYPREINSARKWFIIELNLPLIEETILDFFGACVDAAPTIEVIKLIYYILFQLPQLNELINPPFHYVATLPRNGKLSARKTI